MTKRPQILTNRPRPPWAIRILTARTTRKLSQTELGALIGRKQSVVGQYEAGVTEPDLTTFDALATALNVDPGWLAFGQEGDRDTFVGAILEGQKDDRLFAWAFHETARMLAEEGLQGDLAFTVTYTRKFVDAAKGLSNDARAKKTIRWAINQERMEIRQRLKLVRKQPK